MDSHGYLQVTDPVDELAEAAMAFARAILAARSVSAEGNLSVAAAAERLGVSRSQMYNLIKQGEIASLRIGSRRLIPASEIRRLTRR